MIWRWVAVGALMVTSVLSIALWRNAAERASLKNSVAALEARIEFADKARVIEANRAQAAAERARKLDATIETLLTGGIPDAPLDPALVDLLDRLHD